MTPLQVLCLTSTLDAMLLVQCMVDTTINSSHKCSNTASITRLINTLDSNKISLQAIKARKEPNVSSYAMISV